MARAIPKVEVRLEFEQSRRLLERAARVIAGGVNSNVRLREQPRPLYFESADGPYVNDVDGNRLIDYSLGNGPMLLGHRPRRVTEAVKAQLDVGLLYAGQHQLEIEVAELLVEHVPCAELVRFSQTGTEAVLAAIRMARAATGRQKVLKFQGHYHGWADALHFGLTGLAPPASDGISLEPIEASAGQQHSISDDIVVATWNDDQGLTTILDEFGADLAAVIVEPVMSNGCAGPQPGFLKLLRDLCDQYGIALIFDEIITGFRFGLAGAQGLFNVTPDLAVLGKSMASGFPVSAVAGRRALFEGVISGDVVHSGTYNGSPVGLAAALATLQTLADPDEAVYERLDDVGSRLMAGLREAVSSSPIPALVQGYPPFSFLGFTAEIEIRDHRGLASLDMHAARSFMAQVVARGIRPYSRPAWMVSAAHTREDIDRTVDVCADVLSGMGR